MSPPYTSPPPPTDEYTRRRYTQLLNGLTPSRYQVELFRFVEDCVAGRRAGSAIVNAVAGSSKTTSIVAAAKLLPFSARAVFLAFNKSIAVELGKKLPRNVEAMTTHSLCYRAMGSCGVRFQFEGNKLARMMDEALSVPEKMQLRGQIRKLVGMAKANGLVPAGISTGMATGLVADTDEFWEQIIETYAIDFDDAWQEETAIARARDLLKLSIDDSRIDFDDMLYLPVVLRIPLPKYDWMFVDEAQDLSAIQHEVLRRIAKPTSHMVAVGDKNQGIYQFRGAMTNSMDELQAKFGAETLALSICYRCARSIVAEARQIVPEIEAAPWAPEGLVINGLPKGGLDDFTADAAVLCPYNAPLIKAAYMFIRSRIACRVLGRDLGEGLSKLVRKLERGGAGNVLEVERAVDEYYKSEMARLAGKEARQEALTDKVDTLRIFLGELPAGETVQRLIREIESLYADSADGLLTLSTGHRAKGLEFPKAFLLDAHFLDGDTRGGKKLRSWEVQQRQNLRYVMITRAMEQLAYITSDDLMRLA